MSAETFWHMLGDAFLGAWAAASLLVVEEAIKQAWEGLD